MGGALGSFAAVKLMTTRGRVLCIALTRPHLTQDEIGKALGIPFQNVNRSLGELVEAKLLVKERIGRRSFYSPGPELRWSVDLRYLTELAESDYATFQYLNAGE